MGKSLGVTRRGDTFHLRKRVPARYRDIEGRDTVWISLHTDSESVAKSKADRAWSQMIEAWEAKLAGDTEDAESRFAAAQELARVRGFRYLDVGKVAKLPVEALIERVEAVPGLAGISATFVSAGSSGRSFADQRLSTGLLEWFHGTQYLESGTATDTTECSPQVRARG